MRGGLAVQKRTQLSDTWRGTPEVTAPGKVVISGEYAVLHVPGYRRRRRSPGCRELPTDDDGDPPGLTPGIACATNPPAALPDGCHLMSAPSFSSPHPEAGLFSSAAAAVAVGAAFEFVARTPKTTETLYFESRTPHRRRVPGLGHDTRVGLRGILRFQSRLAPLPASGEPKPPMPTINPVSWPDPLHLTVFWTGSAAKQRP